MEPPRCRPVEPSNLRLSAKFLRLRSVAFVGTVIGSFGSRLGSTRPDLEGFDERARTFVGEAVATARLQPSIECEGEALDDQPVALTEL
jgi:hypothetical protein